MRDLDEIEAVARQYLGGKCPMSAASQRVLCGALLAVMPVLKAAEAWRSSKCLALAGCEHGTHDTDCPEIAVEVALSRAIDTMRKGWG